MEGFDARKLGPRCCRREKSIFERPVPASKSGYEKEEGASAQETLQPAGCIKVGGRLRLYCSVSKRATVKPSVSG